MKSGYDLQRIETAALTLEYFLVPWDSEIFGFPVTQIERIRVGDLAAAAADFTRFDSRLRSAGVRLASCRLAHDRLAESMFLEGCGFRFVELVYPLHLEALDALAFPQEGIEFLQAQAADLAEIQTIAGQAFATGRFNIDPRLGLELGGRRYAAWVGDSLRHATQRVYKVLAEGRIAVFMVTELLPGNRAYWHLTAVAPDFQGGGIGKHAWRAMIMLNKTQGARRIETTISARNTPVVNLYVNLRFRFQPPLMTLHWWRG